MSLSGRGLTRVPDDIFAAGFFRHGHGMCFEGHIDAAHRTLCLDDNSFTELPDSLRCLTSLLELQVVDI
jgi:hypothetical protein